MGKIRNPQYRIVVADSRTKRDGRAIEYVGIYHPKEDPSLIEVKSDRVQHWLSVGAQPSNAVQRLLEKTGDWQKFKGLPAPPPLLVAEAKADRRATYEAEAKAAAGVEDAPAKPARKAAKAAPAEKAAKAAPASAGAAPAAAPAKAAPAEAAPAEASAEAAPAEAAPAEAAPAEAAPAEAAPAEAEAAPAETAAAPAAASAEKTEEQTGAGSGEQA
jgi:small subunit ribosomal protein S16